MNKKCFRPLTGIMFLFPVCITPLASLSCTSCCGADGFVVIYCVRNAFKNRRIPHIRYNGADSLVWEKLYAYYTVFIGIMQ